LDTFKLNPFGFGDPAAVQRVGHLPGVGDETGVAGIQVDLDRAGVLEPLDRLGEQRRRSVPGLAPAALDLVRHRVRLHDHRNRPGGQPAEQLPHPSTVVPGVRRAPAENSPQSRPGMV
jgi:hypothetical protein